MENGLKLNSKKTVIVNFNVNARSSDNDTDPLLYLYGKSVQVLNETKFLGLIIDNKLKWDSHINRTALLVASGCFLVKRIMKTCDFNSAKAVYFAYVHSRLNYGIVMWGQSQLASKLFRLQKRAVRYLANVSYNPTTPGTFYKDSCRPLFTRFNILPLPCIYIYSITMYVIQNKHVERNVETHSHLLRGNNVTNLSVKNMSDKSPVSMGVRIFNKLPADIKARLTKQDFAVKLMNFLTSNCLYSLNEYFNL